MVAKRRSGDRREHLRFEVSGQLWGALERRERVVLHNIATEGALLEATLTTGLKSLRAVQVLLRESGPSLDAVIRHISPLAGSADDDRYLIGLEFVNVSSATQMELDRFVHEWSQHADR